MRIKYISGRWYIVAIVVQCIDGDGVGMILVVTRATIDSRVVSRYRMFEWRIVCIWKHDDILPRMSEQVDNVDFAVNAPLDSHLVAKRVVVDIDCGTYGGNMR